MTFENFSIQDNNSEELLVTFGGIRKGMGMPVFEFYNSLRDLNCDKVYIKDIYQAWYHKGVDQNINNISKLKQSLQHLIVRKSYKNVVFVGNSMGGYGAILLGVLLDVDYVIAFSPQTFIDRFNRLWFKDRRWANEISQVYLSNKNQSKFYNLKTFLKKHKYSTQIDIFYSTNDVLDSLHSERLKSQRNINLFPIVKGNHNVVKVLRDEGDLIKILGERICKF